MLKMLMGPQSDSSKKKKPTVLKGRVKHRISVEDRVALKETTRQLTTETRNCLTCKLFTSCTKKAKGFDYLCDKYKQRKAGMDLSIFNEPDKTNKSGKTIKRLDSKRYSDPESLEFDIEKTISNIVDNGVGLPPDFRVDDSDFPEAENFFHFATHEDYLNYKPRAKQLEVALNLFTDYCHSSKCSNVAYMRCIPPDAQYDEILDNCTLLKHGICPKCKRTRFDMWREFNVPMYNELTGVAGQRGGKSALVAMLGGYTIHRFLKLPNPTQVFNQLPNSFFHGTFTATTFTQAQEAIFDPLFEIIDNSPWFKAYHELLDERGKKLGRELYKFKDTFFQYDHRNMLVYPAAPDKKNLRGRTRFLGGIDELGWFFAKSKGAIKLDPDEVYDSMRNSFITLRSETYMLYEAGHFNIPPPIFCNVSSPSSARDKIMRLTHEAKSEPTMYSFHYSTQEMNPRIHPKVLEPYKKNMSSYRRDILAIPPDSSSPFISNRKSIIGCMDKTMKNMVHLHQHEIVSPSGVPMMSGKFTIVNGGRNANPGRLMTIDAGQRFNSFAATIMHLEETDDKLVPCLDAAFEIIPTDKNAVSFHAVYNSVLKPLIEEMNIRMVAADRWNSIKMLEDLENDCDITQTTYSVKYTDMLETRQAIINGGVILPKGEIKIADAFRLSGNDYPHCMKGYPMSHLYMQMLSVEDVMGKSVEKGQGYTDDLWRAFALGHALIVDEEVQGIIMAEDTPNVQTRSLGVVGSYGDSGGTSGGSGAENRFGVVGSMGGGGSGSMTFSRGGR